MAENKKFLELLVKKNIVTEEKLASLSEEFENDASDILNYLVENNMADKNKLGRMWGDSLGISYVDLGKVAFSENVIKKMPENFARRHKVIPIYQMGNAITVATSKPKNTFLLGKVEQELDIQVNPLFAFEDDIENAIDYYYSSYDYEEPAPAREHKQQAKLQPDLNKPPISQEQHQYLASNTKKFMDDLHDGKPVNAATTHNISTFITDHITNKFDLGFCVSQLRIHDEFTYSHSVNTAILASSLGKSLGLGTNLVKEVTLAGLLHDVGYMRVPKIVLYKTEALTPEEYEPKKRHTLLGYEIIKNMGLQEKIAEVALKHHETINGNGYPNSLRGDQIPLYAQIVSIVNLYDRLVSDKPNKQAVSHHEAINVLLIEGAGLFNYDLLHKFVYIAYKQDLTSLKKVFKNAVFGELI